MLRIASEQCGHEAYPQQNSFRNGIYPQSVNMIFILFSITLSHTHIVWEF